MVGEMSELASEPITVDVVSDVMCPWCYIGKRRLEKALAESPVPIVVRWHPFQLDPTLPEGGKDRKQYLAEKFGSAGLAADRYAHVEAAGAAEGIPFAFEKIAVSPNTLDAHRLVRWAAAEGREDAVVEALFRAYFIEGRNLADRAVLAAVAGEAGLDAEAIARRLATDEDIPEITAQIRRAGEIGITGVPTFIVGNRYAVVGAQPPEAILQAVAAVARERDVEPTETGV